MRYYSLQNVRKRAGLTQTELAAKSGVSTVTISFIENGTNNPGPKVRELLEVELGPIDWLNNREMPMKGKPMAPYEVEQAFYKVFTKIQGLPMNEKLSFLVSAKSFFDRFLLMEKTRAEMQLRRDGVDFAEEEKKYMSDLQKRLSYEKTINNS
ncbi:MAG: helix-turn-helix domain-containing protein [Bacteroidales bacterium]|nr:helix-turn-helix domain-containing protein [Bacteroidales bacterium]MCF8336426.1 helix-turn-helix domain-containing protein [Bacteroidales bacterium]